MTNEEKAIEISWIYHKEYWYEGCDGGEYYNDSVGECEASALEMAEWKDRQFKDYLEKKRQKIVSILEDITEEDARHFALYQRYVYLGIIINELFPNAEQDNTDRDE